MSSNALPADAAPPAPAGADANLAVVAPTVLSGATRSRILVYVSVLILLLGFGSPVGGLIDVPVTFFLKNKLHLSANAVAMFRLAAAIPLFASAAFGFVRDRWSPFGRGDRGFLILFGALAAAAYVTFAFAPATYAGLLTAIVVLTAAYLFASSAQAGLTAALGQQHVMSGQMSTVFNIFLAIPSLAAPLAGGILSQRLERVGAEVAARTLFLVGAAIMAGVALFGLWRPSAVYDQLKSERGAAGSVLKDLARLVRHKPIYPALLIWLLWNFAPGAQTPLQYYMQNTLHASDAQWGAMGAIAFLGFIPTYLLFGWLCQRVPLKRLLFWGTLVGVPQVIPMLFMPSVGWAYVAAAGGGLMGGVCTAAYLDLIIRSCPAGLQGTMLMASTTASYLASRLGDVLGTWLYDRFGGFPVCIAAITIVYALIVPALRLVPGRLVDTGDGQAPALAYAAD